MVSRLKKSDASSESVSRPGKKPKLVVHAACDVGISSDGYRWRKYGQKMVKGNPHPRYYIFSCFTLDKSFSFCQKDWCHIDVFLDSYLILLMDERAIMMHPILLLKDECYSSCTLFCFVRILRHSSCNNFLHVFHFKLEIWVLYMQHQFGLLLKEVEMPSLESNKEK